MTIASRQPAVRRARQAPPDYAPEFLKGPRPVVVLDERTCEVLYVGTSEDLLVSLADPAE